MKQRSKWILALAVLFFAASSLAGPVVRDGKEWLQPADFVNLTWNQVEAVCPELDGFLCNGELNGIDVTGFTFASIEQITDLFNSYGIDPPVQVGELRREADSPWAPAFFSDFNLTFTNNGLARLTCWSTTPWRDTADYLIPYLQDSPDSEDDFAVIRDFEWLPFESGGPTIGACLFREAPIPTSAPKAVPTMSAYVLIFTIIGLIAVASGGLFRRKFRDG